MSTREEYIDSLMKPGQLYRSVPKCIEIAGNVIELNNNSIFLFISCKKEIKDVHVGCSCILLLTHLGQNYLISRSFGYTSYKNLIDSEAGEFKVKEMFNTGFKLI